MDEEMWRALQADGEKLRQLTGEDHGPWTVPKQWVVCDACDGSGEETFGYWGCEPGCGHAHVIEDGRPCSKCNGDGGWIEDVAPDATFAERDHG